jgi:hypothetical protein
MSCHRYSWTKYTNPGTEPFDDHLSGRRAHRPFWRAFLIGVAGVLRVLGFVVAGTKVKRPHKGLDYLLRYRRDFPIAVVKAKAIYAHPGDGLQQAKSMRRFWASSSCMRRTAAGFSSTTSLRASPMIWPVFGRRMI